jgi:hypothetical protein
MDDKARLRIEETLAEMGWKGIRCLKWRIAVRTEDLPQKTKGGIWLPPKLTNFYGELPHLQQLAGLVLATNQKALVEVGDRVAFQRLHFERWFKMSDGTYIGSIDQNYLYGFAEDDHELQNDQRASDGASRVAPV